MDKLLTIKEAASLLNVSEISLRRWTNSGKLKCYRVGGKKERRFEKQEIQKFLCRGNGTFPLGIRNFSVKNSDHISHFYEKIEECLDEGLSYLAKGLSLGEHILIISTKTRMPIILAGLEGLGFQVSQLLADGTIITNTGLADVANQLHFINKSVAGLQSQKGLRLLGDMVWATELGWSLENIKTLENNTNLFLTHSEALILCQYDVTNFGADVAMMALETHNITVYRGRLTENPYFVGAKIH